MQNLLIQNLELFKNKQNIVFIFILLILLPVFIPEGYEPGGECFNEWGAARLLLDGEGFPKISLSLGYVLYSAFLMNFFNYNLFISVEYFFTFSFFYISLFFLLKIWLKPLNSFIVTICSMPVFSTIEGHNMVLAIAFVLIYLRNLFLCNNKYSLPLSLFLACSCSSTFIFVLFGHYLTITWQLIKNKNILKTIKFLKEKKYYNPKFFIFLCLGLFYIIAYTNPSPRLDNNHFLDSMPWAPVENSSAFNLAVMQINPAIYLSRRISIEEAANQDWYFTNKTLFKDAQNIKEAILNAPHVFVENIGLNLKYLVIAPNAFLLKLNNKPVIIISFLITFFSFIYFFFYLFKKNPFIFWPFLTGISSLIFVLLLTTTNNLRYNVALYPFLISIILFTLTNFKIKMFNKYILLNAFVFLLVIANISFFTITYEKNLNFKSWPILFSNKNGFNYHFKDLKKLIRDDDKMLVLSSKWVKAFFGINHSQVYSLHYLPPFYDKATYEKMKDNITHFWVEESVKSIKTTNASTNVHLRYKLFLIPLINYAKEQNWEIINFRGFGQVYRKKDL